MEHEIKLWGRRTSINVQKVVWIINELALPYTHIDAGGQFGGLDDPAYIEMNPNGRIPTLVDADLTLWESNTICRYLVDAYGTETTLRTRTTPAKAQADMWMEWFQNNVYADLTALFYQDIRLPPSLRDPAKRRHVNDALNTSLKLFDTGLEGRKFIIGDDLSLGDIPTGSCLYRYFTMQIERPQLLNLERYYADLSDRQSYRDAVMVDYSSLRGAD